MSNKKRILDIGEENQGIITSKKVDELKIPRFYLSQLLKEGKIVKIDRGIYSTKENNSDEYYNLQVKSKIIIFSHFTALKLLGFYDSCFDKTHISVPQGYNATRIDNHYKVFYDNHDIYKDGVVEVINDNNLKLKVYDIERSICDIIKNKNRFKIDQVNRLMNFYFMRATINYKKLLYYSKLLNVSKQVKRYLSLFKA